MIMDFFSMDHNNHNNNNILFFFIFLPLIHSQTMSIKYFNKLFIHTLISGMKWKSIHAINYSLNCIKVEKMVDGSRKAFFFKVMVWVWVWFYVLCARVKAYYFEQIRIKIESTKQCFIEVNIIIEFSVFLSTTFMMCF